MCERRDSIAAMSAAADRLAEACEARLKGGCPVDPAQPARSGISKALRTALRDVSVTPADMALQLRKLDK